MRRITTQSFAESRRCSEVLCSAAVCKVKPFCEYPQEKTQMFEQTHNKEMQQLLLKPSFLINNYLHGYLCKQVTQLFKFNLFNEEKRTLFWGIFSHTIFHFNHRKTNHLTSWLSFFQPPLSMSQVQPVRETLFFAATVSLQRIHLPTICPHQLEDTSGEKGFSHNNICEGSAWVTSNNLTSD